jgi:peptidase E
MVNILFDCPNISDFKDNLAHYIPKNSRVTVVAFSFYDDYVYDNESWQRVYGEGIGEGYFEVVDEFAAFGVPKENVTYVNYFTDTKESAKKKIAEADIIYFTGGLPDRMMERIVEFELTDTLKSFDGVVIGYSAGAVIQLKEYHLYPDGDYADFGYYDGLGYVDGIYLEVHYEYKSEQDESVRRALHERNLPIYVTHTRKGGVIVEGEKIITVGKVDLYKK